MTKASPRLVGAFVVGGVALLIGGILTLGSLQFLKTRVPVVMYFEEDLSGLDPGAPVTFRGVQIGTVTDIALRFNADTRSFQSPVRVTLEPDRFQVEGTRPRKMGQNLPYFVEQGLRARLASQSILTGKMLIELGFHPGTPAHVSRVQSEVAEIPTLPSQMEALQAGIEGTLRKLEQAPLSELIDDLRATVRALGTAISQVDTARISVLADDASTTMRSGRDLINNVGQHVDAIGPKGEAAMQHADELLQELQKSATRIGPVIANMQRAVDRADRFLADANGVIEPGSPTHRELMATLREISASARSMRVLTDELGRNPNSLLFGRTSSGGR